MPHLIAIEGSESQRRQIKEKIIELGKKGWPLNGKLEAGNFGNWNSLFENTISPGLFVQRETIAIENSDILGIFPENLISFLEDEKSECILLLIFNGDLKNLKNIPKILIEIIKPEAQISPWKRREWLINLAESLNFKLSRDAAQLLADSIESQEELRSEITKLALYSNNREIKLSDVQELSFDEGGKAQLTFLDGVCENRPIDVAKSLKYLKQTPILPVLTAISNRLRPALISSCFNINKDSALKAAGIDPAKKNYALFKAKTALKNFGEEAIKNFILKIIRLSYLEKTNSAESWQGFEIALWELMLKI